jgi:hypothetical protein
MSHIQFEKSNDGGLYVNFCSQGLLCGACREIMNHLTRQDLKIWTKEVFGGTTKEMIQMSWTFTSESIENDPIFFLALKNQLKKFWKKFSTSHVLITITPNLVFKGVDLKVFIVDDNLNEVVVYTSINNWSEAESKMKIEHDKEVLDEYDFYVESLPFRFTDKEVEFISSYPQGHVIRESLECQIDVYPSQDNEVETLSLLGVNDVKGGLN